MAASPVQEKSYRFALSIIGIHRELVGANEFVISRQLLKSGTSIGANIEEASAAQSKADFLSKMAIASKEARETRYWLRLLRDSGLLDNSKAMVLLDDADEMIRLLTAIVKTTSRTVKGKPLKI